MTRFLPEFSDMVTGIRSAGGLIATGGASA
jgi:hypothetical protein